MAIVILFHSVLGLRPAVRATADVFRRAGHQVYVPDLYRGEVFDDMDAAVRFFTELGIPEMITRTDAAVAGLPTDVVYAGFSNGGVSAEYLAATRPGARGVLLMHAALPIAELGGTWPRAAPAQVHYARDDPWRTPDGVDRLRAEVEAAGGVFTLFEYPVSGHLFTDAGLPEFDAASSDLAHSRMLEFLRDR
ncbi:dienelactone hydrolase family protein [Tsukamurella soli]|uniref:Dienelactone hydrolase family protein n=1 Tax=Tsukamurella soli TaxID=644556 RepID=A0ABP8KJ00_9ACTN